MIRDFHSGSDSCESVIVSHITDGLADLYGKHFPLSSWSVEELARAVERFLEQEGNRGVVDSTRLVLLASRALSSIGEERTARRFVLFGTGLVRPSEWEVTYGEEMWVLDLKQMTVRDDAALELLFFAGLRVILESVADVWDESGGSGVLGLRHVCAAASAVMGDSGDREKVLALSAEIKDLCGRKLRQVGRERGWKDVPQLMNLDM